MSLADKTNVLKRVIRILNANAGAWSAAVSGKVGSFPDTTEIDAAVLEADEMICVSGYFQSVNRSLSSPFLTLSSNLTNGDAVPQIRGMKPANVEYSGDGATFKKAVEANNVDDITNAIALGNRSGVGAFKHLYKIDGGVIHIVSPFARVQYPAYTRTDELQCNKNEETLCIFTAVRLLTKHASPVPFEIYTKESVRGIQQLVQEGVYTAQEEVKE